MPQLAEARLVVGRVVVHGDIKTSVRVLSARMHLFPGDEVNFEILTSAEQRLIESELFTQARVYVDLPRAEAARHMYLEFRDFPIDVHVAATEKQSWFVAPIGSFGSGDYAGGLAYGDRNLGGRDVQLVSALQIGQSRSFIFVGYRDPRLVDAPLTWGAAGLFRYEQIRFFSGHREVLRVPTRVGGGEAEFGWVLSPHLYATIGFSARYQRVYQEEVRDPEATLPAINRLSGRIFRLVFQAMYDNTIAPTGLRRGVRLLMKNEVADRFWGSQFDYNKFEGRVEVYGRFGWNYPSLTFKTIFDFPTSTRGVPITEMLRIGGTSLRGYLYNEFHGDTLVSAQVEDQVLVLRGIKVPLLRTRFNIAAAGFVDAASLLERHPGGTAVELPVESRPKLKDVHTSVGAGFRIILPGVAIPAIKADLAYGIDVRSFAVAISIGGTG
ncbi:MAG: BamA/TamA family outer membrane protein [Myxococcales bacterium]